MYLIESYKKHQEEECETKYFTRRFSKLSGLLFPPLVSCSVIENGLVEVCVATPSNPEKDKATTTNSLSLSQYHNTHTQMIYKIME